MGQPSTAADGRTAERVITATYAHCVQLQPEDEDVAIGTWLIIPLRPEVEQRPMLLHLYQGPHGCALQLARSNPDHVAVCEWLRLPTILGYETLIFETLHVRGEKAYSLTRAMVRKVARGEIAVTPTSLGERMVWKAAIRHIEAMASVDT